MKLNTNRLATNKKPNLEVAATSKFSSGNSTTSKTPVNVTKTNTPDVKNHDVTKENRKPNTAVQAPAAEKPDSKDQKALKPIPPKANTVKKPMGGIESLKRSEEKTS